MSKSTVNSFNRCFLDSPERSLRTTSCRQLWTQEETRSGEAAPAIRSDMTLPIRVCSLLRPQAVRRLSATSSRRPCLPRILAAPVSAGGMCCDLPLSRFRHVSQLAEVRYNVHETWSSRACTLRLTARDWVRACDRKAADQMSVSQVWIGHYPRARSRFRCVYPVAGDLGFGAVLLLQVIPVLKRL